MVPSNMYGGSIWFSDGVTVKPLNTATNIVEELTAKCMGQEYCVVVDKGGCYNNYRMWVDVRFPDYLEYFEEGRSNIVNDRLYRVIGHAPHLLQPERELYLIQDMDTEQVFVIDGDDINITTTATTIKNYTDTLYCDDNIDAAQYTCKIRGGERIMNNKLVDLYYNRKREEIKEKYVELLKKEYEELDVVKEYNELVETFKTSLAEMASRYNTEETKVLVRTGYTNTYMYELNDSLKDELKDAHREEFDKEMKNLELVVEEVRAQLSLSDDKDYQVDILTRYDIINKKGKLNV